ncbi:hypothetical protein ACIOJD_33625 [Streptomyces sp. NPDC088116]|uniref:hypothetical protein n=1 Tax=Streptomyces sp. NPDC088116 TaxID=3365825 RepID=UPI0037FF5F26
MEHQLSTTEDGQNELTIRWNKEDDPTGVLEGWIAKGFLQSFLRTFPKPTEGGSPIHADDAYHLALGVNWLAEHSERRLELLLLLMRDKYQASWGTLGAALDVSRSTAKSRYQTIARRYAERGHYVDESGLRSGPPAEVKKLVAARLSSRDTQDKLIANAVANLQAGSRVTLRSDTSKQGTAVRRALGEWVIDWDDDRELLTMREDIIPL